MIMVDSWKKDNDGKSSLFLGMHSIDLILSLWTHFIIAKLKDNEPILLEKKYLYEKIYIFKELTKYMR